MKRVFTFCFCCLLVMGVKSQAIYGTTGLLHMPTADMQKDKTFMLGGNALDVATLPRYWSNHDEYTPYTFNYYISITFFPWLEIGYTCTLVKGLYNSHYWPEHTWGKFCNQDRSFHGRLRLWKEGWWKDWTPQIVLGANDPGSHSDNGGGDITAGGENGNHNYLTRYYLAATKHFDFKHIGQLGVHAAFIIGNAMTDEHYKRPAFGVNFQFTTTGSCIGNKVLNGLNLMAEYDALTVNVGGSYSIWKDHINLIAELNDGKYFSGGIFFKVHLK